VDIDTACKAAVDKRFRPIILSTSTSVLGLIPLILSGNVLFTGMSIAFMFGLSTSLFFTLIVIPVLYSILMRNTAAKKAE
jgi:multidrug efflux pump subunit AcrB